jgi:putative Mn2+ efflux pump MntP
MRKINYIKELGPVLLFLIFIVIGIFRLRNAIANNDTLHIYTAAGSIVLGIVGAVIVINLFLKNKNRRYLD